MYAGVLFLHSYVRWAVLGLGIAAWIRVLIGSRKMASARRGDDPVARWFVTALDVQVALGLLMHLALSPITRAAFGSPGAVMGNTLLRFYTIEHPFGMIVALAFAHIGAARARRAPTRERARRSRLIFFGLAVAVILAAIPWPFVPAGRPYFRW